MRSTIALWVANDRRHVAQAPQQVEDARRALPYARTQAERHALQLRIAHPAATLTDLSVLSGLSKDAYWSRLRRGIQRAL